MGNNHDNIALDWVRSEIQETLLQGQHALESYVENPEDTSRLRFCLNHLHQVHGTLQMVELYGAALLTEEMEKVAQALLNETLGEPDDAIQILMQAMLRLPQYLETLTSSRDDFPMALLPTLNDLRASRGEGLLSDTSLFNPDLEPARFKPAAGVSRRIHDPKVLGHLAKLRNMAQFAIAGICGESDLDSHFDYLDKVIARLIKLCQRTPNGELWFAAGAFLDTLKARRNSITVAVKALLQELDQQLKRLIDEHIDSLQQPVNEPLLKNLLYYVARAADLDSPRVQKVVASYHLERALPSEQHIDEAKNRISGPSRDAIHSVVGALNEELAKLKDNLDLFVRAEYRRNPDLEDLLPGLQQIANTLAVLGLGIPRRVIGEQTDLIQKLSAQEDPIDDGILMDIAGSLLYVEATLTGLDEDRGPRSAGDNQAFDMGGRHLNEANEALLREARNSLEQVKSAILNFITSDWNHQEVASVPKLLHSIRGGLALLPLERAGELLASAQRYVEDVLLSNRRVPDWQQLDTLADAITSIEYYLERLADGVQENESILQIAEQSMASLGFPAGEAPTWDASNTPQTPEPEPPAEPVTTADSADLIDDEILEIFVEEADEVLASIRRNYPLMRSDIENRDALAEVRRAFHTLKGSGRLVGATSIGELAWSVENMLNGIIDRSISAGASHFTLLDQVIDRLPELIEGCRQGQMGPDVDELMSEANRLSDTRQSTSAPADEALPVLEEVASEEELTAEAEAGLPEPAESSNDDDLIDSEILEIFVEEAGEVLGTINEYLPRLRDSHDDQSALTEVRRAFHTLKGSGRLVGANEIGELAWSVENMLNRVLDGTILMNDAIATLLQDVVTALPDLVSDFESQKPASVDCGPWMEQAGQLASGEVGKIPMPDEGAEQSHGEQQGELDVADFADEFSEAIDPVLLDIFRSETETHLQTLEDYARDAAQHDQPTFTDNLTRALHTLKGSAHTANIEPIARVVAPLEKFVKTARAENRWPGPGFLELVERAASFVRAGLSQIETAPQAPLPGTEAFLEDLDKLAAATLDQPASGEERPANRPDPQLISLFLNEGMDIILDADTILDAWSRDPQEDEKLAELTLELRRLSKGAEQAGLAHPAELADTLEHLYELARRQSEHPAAEFFECTRLGHELLINMMDQVAAGLATKPDNALLAQLREYIAQFEEASRPRELPPEFAQDLDDFDKSMGEYPETAELEEEPGEKLDPEQPVEPQAATAGTALDPELVQIFLEEATDLVDHIGETLNRLTSEPENPALTEQLLRDLHTLKGGARLAEINTIGDLVHDLETLFERLVDGRLSRSEAVDDLMMRCHDRLAVMIEAVSSDHQPRPAPDLIDEIQRLVDEPTGKSRSAGETAPTVETAQAASDEVLELDPEMAEIFLDEAGDIIQTTGELLHQWETSPEQLDPVKNLQRELHTLKGGARMAEIAPIADLAHELETLFERLVEGRMETSADALGLAMASHDQLATMVESVAETGSCPAAPELLAALHSLLEAEPSESGATAAQGDEAGAFEPNLDPELVGIFLEEAYDLINSTASHLHAWTEDPDNRELAANLQRDLHTLKGGARMANVPAIGDLAHLLEDLFERIAEGRMQAGADTHELLFACHDRLANMVEEVASGKPCSAAEDLLERVAGALGSGSAATSEVPTAESASDEPPAEEEDAVGLFLTEAREIQVAINECLDQWQRDADGLHGVTQLLDELDALRGGARLAGLENLAKLGDAWHAAVEPIMSGDPGIPELQKLSGECVERVGKVLDQLEASVSPDPADDLIDRLQALGDQAQLEPLPDSLSVPPAVDSEVLEIFLEEADELTDSLDHLLADWKKDPGNVSFNQEAQRALHTIKGGARLAQITELGNEAHAFEALLIDLQNRSRQPDAGDWEKITAYHDHLLSLVDQVRKRAGSQTGKEKAGQPGQAPRPAEQNNQTEAAPAPQPQAAKPAPKKAPEPARTAAPQETIRVNAGLLDTLVNLAGETSITRGRMETQISDFGHTLDEMAATIERLREQLRRMEIETETQILFRAEQELGPDYDSDFDPLEMDRYSSIQQLSRALSESSSDLADLRETLGDRVRDSETLLVQQSRINTELQEGLMKTRMIPFSSMVPRLRRIVRQISGELGKKVEFDVRNAEGEMDRNVLERMIAPLEHMLRNALDHGIESAKNRKKAGKPEAGTIELSLQREGGDVVMRMVDDGAGIRIDKIRQKAVKQGLLNKNDTELSDRDILQFILQPGFSTAQKVTQISGRGVGMDVVASEIKQLGGSLDIDSKLGIGTTFTIRLPFTVSVNRALMVATGEDFYAIPLNTIEGIVRVSTYELEEYYQPNAPLYEYAGQQYRLQYLGTLLHSDHQPKLQGQALPLPVILVRGAEQPIALQVDSLMGSREIVVKSLGPQFASVRGVSGATILGDGSVVVILDLPAMIRSDILAQRQRMMDTFQPGDSRRDQQTTLVMVVDDSVTVRKVTSRLLERNGMEVMTAKDGLDAVAQLQDHLPDVILLDIEMPRMDGFEVASFVRHDERLQDTPICMITSRTGGKHRERAMAIGVNEYLGKPFQETELLDIIERLARKV